jgi:hypothetical protein
MRKRKVWIEPMFAEAKQWHGMDRVRLRTLERVNTEVLVTAAGQNMKRLLSSGDRGPRKLALAAALRPPGRPRLPRFYHRPTKHSRVSQHAAGDGAGSMFTREPEERRVSSGIPIRA